MDNEEPQKEEQKNSNPGTIKLGVLIVVVAFSLGLFYPTIIEWFNPTPKPPTELQITTPKEGENIPTDTFSVRLFHYYLNRVPTGNLIVTPDIITRSLNEIQRLADSQYTELFTPLQLHDKPTESSADIHSACFLFTNAKDTTKQVEENEIIYPVSFSDDLASAHQIMNAAVQARTNGAIEYMFSGSSAPKGTRVLAAAVLGFTADWYYPFYHHRTEDSVFRNADATRSKVPFMTAEGHFRVAQDPQGKWQAIALFLRNAAKTENKEACAFIIILPTEEWPLSARPLASSLTAEDYGKIRTALAKAEEKAAIIKLPRISESSYRIDMFPALQAMGLRALADTHAAPFPALSSTTPFPLDGFYQQCSLRFRESAGNVGSPGTFPGSNTTLEINRPFVWMLCPLATPEPPYAMGVQEYL